MKKIKIVPVLLLLLLVLTACQSSAEKKQAELRGEYFDFAVKYRLDYIPVFAAGETPQISSEYLTWAFAVNLDNWGEDKGVMSKAYVEEMIRKYFAVDEVMHEGLMKTWDYDESCYRAVPSSIKELPAAVSKEMSVEEKDGQTIYTVNMDFCASADGNLFADYNELRKNIVKGQYDGLEVMSNETFVYYLNDGEPIFLAHTIN